MTGRYLHPFHFCKLTEVSALFAAKKKNVLFLALWDVFLHTICNRELERSSFLLVFCEISILSSESEKSLVDQK